MGVSAILLSSLSGTEGSPTNELRRKRQTVEEVGTKVGCLVTRLHQVTLGVYFYIALEGTAKPYSAKNSIPINWPNPSSLERTPVKRPFNKQDIVINLPADISADKVTWLSLWCEEFAISFGDLAFNSKKPKENACAPGAKKAQAPVAAAKLPGVIPGLGLTNEQLAIVLSNPALLQQFQAQGLLLQLA